MLDTQRMGLFYAFPATQRPPTCKEIDKVLEVLHDRRAEGHAAQGDRLVPDDLAPTLGALEGRAGDCAAQQAVSVLSICAALTSMNTSSRRAFKALPPYQSSFLVVARRRLWLCKCDSRLLAHMVAQLWME